MAIRDIATTAAVIDTIADAAQRLKIRSIVLFSIWIN
jgi:hypothetical protein